MEILLQKFEPLVRKYARRIHKLEIDDAMQEMSLAFLQLIRKMDLSKFSGPDADKLFLAYLRRAMETRFLDIVKQQENTIIIAFDEVANQDQEGRITLSGRPVRTARNVGRANGCTAKSNHSEVS